MDVNLFRMAPPMRTTPNPDPPPPPPPPEAWQAVMAATNANTQMIMQILQERNQANQGNQGNNHNRFATLNQFLANQPKTFSNCVEATDADDWLVDLCKHFDCSNVRLRTLSSSLPSNSKIKLQNGSSSTRIPEVDVLSLGMISVEISELIISLRA